jgi:hypothetical protein
MIAIGIITGVISILLLSIAAIEFRRSEVRFLFIAISRQVSPKRFWLMVVLRLLIALFFGFLSFNILTIPSQCDDDGKCTFTLPIAPR